MKYTDIPKYPQSYYKVDYPVEDIPDMLDHYRESQESNGYKLILNPDFQRGHVWTPEQQTSYMQHLLMEGDGGRDIYFNHPEHMRTWKADMVCLDGLQRITAILDFIGDQVQVWGKFYSELEKIYGSERHKTFVPMMNSSLHINILKLKTRKEILFWYLQFNSGGTPHTEKELNKVRKMLEEENDK